MFRNAGLLIVIITMSHLTISAQKAADSTRHKHVRQILGMTDAQYKGYRDSLRWYDQRISSILRSDSLNKTIRSRELADVMTQRRLFMQKHATPDQAAKVHQQNMRNRPVSPRLKQRKELEERLKKKGIKVVKINS
jgi:hypothetical protein